MPKKDKNESKDVSKKTISNETDSKIDIKDLLITAAAISQILSSQGTQLAPEEEAIQKLRTAEIIQGQGDYSELSKDINKNYKQRFLVMELIQLEQAKLKLLSKKSTLENERSCHDEIKKKKQSLSMKILFFCNMNEIFIKNMLIF